MNSKLFTTLDKKTAFSPLFTWESPERPWSPKNRSWYVIYSFFFITLIAVAALLGEFILIIAIIAFIFLWFTQASIPPQIVRHTVTKMGIRTYDKLLKWNDIKHYWFSVKAGVHFLNLEIQNSELTSGNRTHRISLLINEEDQDELFYLLIDYADYGDTDEISYNILTRILNGDYIDIEGFLPEEAPTQEEYLEMSGNISTKVEDNKKSKKKKVYRS